MKKLISLTILLVFGTISAQNSNIFWDRGFWKNATVKNIQEKIADGNDPVGLNPNGFDATVNAILANASDDVVKYLLALDGNDINKITHDGRTYLFWAALRGNLSIMKHAIDKGAKTDILDDKGSTVLLFAAGGGQTSPELYELLLKNGASMMETNPKGTNVLHQLIGKSKSLKDLDYFIKKGLDLNSIDKVGRNAIDYAAKTGNKIIIEQLIEKGVAYKDTNSDGSNAILMAAYGSRNTNNLAFFKYLEGLGIAPNITDNRGQNSIHHLAYRNKDLAIFNYFIGKGVSPTKPDYDGNTPLMSATNRNDLETIKFFVEKTIDINAKNKDGKTALVNAVKGNSYEVVEFLINKGADVNLVDKDKNNLAYYLVDSYSKKNEKSFNMKWDLLTKNGLNLLHIQKESNNLFHLAAAKGDISLLDKIANSKLDINAKNKNGLTPLHIAAMTAEKSELIEHLISLGAKPTILSDFEESAYHLALENELLDKNKIEFLKL